MSTLTATQLQQQYIAYFGRPGDPAGLKYWLSSSSGISSAREFADKIYAQDEYKTSTVGGKSTEAQVNSLYLNLFGREADAKGLIYWTNQIESGVLTLSNIAYDLIAAANNPVAGNETQGAADAKALGNKTAAAIAFTADIEASTSAILAYQPETTTPWKTGAAFESAVTFLKSVTTTAHTSSTIDAAVTTMVAANTSAGSVASASTSKFTTSQDTLVGGAGNDVFNGVLQGGGASGTTIAPGDSAEGKGGIDTLNISVAGDHNQGGAGYTLEAVQTTGVEKLLLSNFETEADEMTTVTAGLMTGLTNVGLSSSSASGDTTFTNIPNLVVGEMRTGAGDLTLSYESSVLAGSDDTQKLTVQGTTAGTFTVNGAETIAVTSSLVDSTLKDITGTELTKITFAGDKAIKVTDALTEKTLDASAAKGAVTLLLGAADQTVTGGSGDDVIDGAAVVTAADTIKGGDGTDTLKIDIAGTTYDGTDTTGELSGVSGFETIEVDSSAASSTLELDNLSGVSTLVANSSTHQLTVSVTNSGDTNETFTATVNGTAITTARVNLNQTNSDSADAGAVASALATAIDANALFGASATGAVVTITTASTTQDSIQTEFTSALAAVTAVAVNSPVVFDKAAGTETVDVYKAGDVTYTLKDGSGLTDSVTFNLKSSKGDKDTSQTVNDLIFTNIETATVSANGLGSSAAYTVRNISGDSTLTTLNITGASDLTISDTASDNSKLATIDGSTFTGDLSLNDSVASLDQTIKTGSGNDTLAMGANLTDKDVIDLGSNTTLSDGTAGKDTVTASGNLGSSSVKDAVLQIANVETIQVTNAGTASTYIDASKITGTQNLAFSNTDGTVKITNLGASATIGLGVGVAEFGETSTTTLDVALADATGSSDSITLDMSDTTNTANEVTLKSTGIETLNISATKEASNNVTNTITFGDNAPSKVVITDGHSGDTLALGTLNKATTTVDASAYKGITTLTGATGVGMTVSAAAPVNNSITTSTGNDTVTLKGDLGATDDTISLGTGTDVLNATLSATNTDSQLWSGIETLNLTIKDSTTAGWDNATDEDVALHNATTINILGGNALSKFRMTTATFDNVAIAQTLDASTFSGTVELNFAADALDSNFTVKGGTSTSDKITVIVATDQKAASVTGIETLAISSSDNDVDADIDLSNFTGLTTIETTFVSSGNDGDQIEINDIPASVTNIKVNSTATSTSDQDNLVLDYANASAADTKGKVEMGTFADTDEILNLDGPGIETLTINNKSGAATNGFDLSGVTATAGSTTSVTLEGQGGNLLNLSSSFDTINAAASTGGLTITAANRPATTMTITGGTGNDSIAMENKSDVLDGGLGSGDTLTVSGNGVLGGFAVDLTSTTDQLTQYAGVANASIQKNFESVDMSGVTGSFGADITGTDANNTITGTLASDNISSGKGTDTIFGGGGADTIDTGIPATGGTNTVDGGAGADTVTFGVGKAHYDMAEADGVAATATNLADDAKPDGKTITYGNGIDTIKGFTAGAASGDVLDGDWGAPLPPLLHLENNIGAVQANDTQMAYGSWNASTKVFTFEDDGYSATFNDALIIHTAASGGADSAGIKAATHVVLLEDLGVALHIDNFV